MKLLIGYDGSPAADAALRDLEMAGLPAEAEARIVVALPPSAPAEAFAVDPTGTGWLAGAYVPVEPTPEQIERAKDHGEHAAYLLKAKFPRWRVSVETAVGTPAQALLEKAEAWKAGLIVVGSHGWSWDAIARRAWPVGVQIRLIAARRLDSGPGRKAVGKAAKGSWPGTERLLDAAVAFHADCIFLGRRGLSGFDRILLGSVSAAVASHAPCSVEVAPG